MLTWCSRAVNLNFLSLFAASRTRASPVGSLIRLGVRHKFGSCVFSLASGLPSTASANDVSLLFGCFVGSTPLYDSPLPCMRDLPLIAFSLRPALLAGGCGVSRFSRMEFLYVPGVFDSAGSPACSRFRTGRFAFWFVRHHRHPGSRYFGAPYPARRYPCPTLQVQPRDCPHMARGQGGSLFLPCTTLPFATPCRFIPALSGRGRPPHRRLTAGSKNQEGTV